MTTIKYLIEAIIYLSSVIILFFSLNRIKFSIKSIVLAIIIRVPIILFFMILKHELSNSFLSYFIIYIDDLIYALLLTLVFLRTRPKTLLIFYGLFPFTLWSLFYRSISYFLLPLYGHSGGIVDDSLTLVINMMCSLSFVFLFINWLGYDFLKLKVINIAMKDKKVLYLSNWVMISYYFIMSILTYMQYEKDIMTIEHRRFILVVYLIIFMGIIKQIDTHLKNKLQEQLDFQRMLQLKNMENYNKQIEELYKEIRSFRHDYINLLTTLRLGIESEDINQVKAIYTSVLKDSDVDFKKHKYDLGRLVNINNSALKSLLATKFIQAKEKQILVNIDVPEVIELQKMDLIDFITVVSILCDNAIEAKPREMSIAFLSSGNKQLLIVENTIKEERMDISRLYDYGVSTKGEGRGIGLYNVMKIVERYPNVSLKTSSQNYKFSQVLEISLFE